MENEIATAKSKKHLSYNLVLGIGAGLILIGAIIGGIIGDAFGMAGDLFSIVSAIMIIVQTFKKDVTTKTKLTGWLLIVVWLIVVAIRSQVAK